jgi:hypothetical protein
MYDFYALKFKIFFKTIRLIIVPEYPGFKRVFLIKDFYYAVKYEPANLYNENWQNRAN